MIIKGNFIDTPVKDTFRIRENAYIVIKGGKTEAVREVAPKTGEEILDYSDSLIIPSFCDMHVHAPQFLQRGMGMDRELIGWLNDYTFPREARFADSNYAREAYEPFVEALYKGGSLRSSIFATIHREASLVLARLLEEKGLSALVGKVNMDSNSPDILRETEEESLRETELFREGMQGSGKTAPIITPRFVPSCSEGLLKGLGDLAARENLPVQSHLCETLKEVAWVKELFPDAESYSQVYDDRGLFRGNKTLMAHGIYLSDDDLARIERDGTVLVHCPDSNLNLTSGIMDVTGLLDRGVEIALGSDVGGGHELLMNRVIVSAVQSSKTRHKFTGGGRILTHEEAFYMATCGGRSHWENTGVFEEGYSFDALVIRDDLPFSGELPVMDRLYRFLYAGDDRDIRERFLEGEKI